RRHPPRTGAAGRRHPDRRPAADWRKRPRRAERRAAHARRAEIRPRELFRYRQRLQARVADRHDGDAQLARRRRALQVAVRTAAVRHGVQDQQTYGRGSVRVVHQLRTSVLIMALRIADCGLRIGLRIPSPYGSWIPVRRGSRTPVRRGSRTPLRYGLRIRARAGLRILAAAVVLAAPTVHAETIDRVLAVAAGNVIMLSDVTAARDLQLQTADGAPDPVRAILAKLIDRELVLAEVERYAPPEPGAAEIDRELERVRARFGAPADFAAALQRSGIDEKHLRETLRQDLRIRAYLDQRFAAAADRRNTMVEEWMAGLRRRGDVIDLYLPSR